MNKKFIKNYFYTVIYQLLIVITPLITMPYKARTLGPTNIGIYSYVFSVFQNLIMLGTIGINLYGRREIAYVKKDKYNRSKLLYELLFLKFITLVSIIIISCVFLKDSDYKLYYFIMLFDIFFNIFDLTWFYQGIEEFKKISLINLIIKILNIICVFTFIKTQQDLITYFIITSAFDIITILSLSIMIPKYIQKIKLKELKIFKHLKMCIILFLPQIFISIYTVCDKIMLGNLSNNISEVGYYEYSHKIISIILNVISSFVLVMVPVISEQFIQKNNEKIKKFMNESINFIIILAIPLTMGIIGVADNLIDVIFGKNYQRMIFLLKLMSFSIIPIGITTIIGEQYLVSIKKEKQFILYVFIGALTNVILNFMLIPKYKALGTCVATVITEFMILILEMPIIKNLVDLKETISNFLKFLFCSIIMLLIVILIGLIQKGYIILIIQVLVGISIYIIMLIIIKDKFFISIIKKIKSIIIEMNLNYK